MNLLFWKVRGKGGGVEGQKKKKRVEKCTRVQRDQQEKKKAAKRLGEESWEGNDLDGISTDVSIIIVGRTLSLVLLSCAFLALVFL